MTWSDEAIEAAFQEAPRQLLTRDEIQIVLDAAVRVDGPVYRPLNAEEQRRVDAGLGVPESRMLIVVEVGEGNDEPVSP
jgi:hypothetical protein